MSVSSHVDTTLKGLAGCRPLRFATKLKWLPTIAEEGIVTGTRNDPLAKRDAALAFLCDGSIPGERNEGIGFGKPGADTVDAGPREPLPGLER